MIYFIELQKGWWKSSQLCPPPFVSPNFVWICGSHQHTMVLEPIYIWKITFKMLRKLIGVGQYKATLLDSFACCFDLLFLPTFLITFFFQSLESFSSFEFLCNFEIVFLLRNCVRIMLPGKWRIASTFLLNLHQPFKVTCVVFKSN